jgi:Fur family transcriptional regulator, iron response regulator
MRVMLRKRIDRKDIVELLGRNGINPTHQRLEIAFALFSRQEHLSAEQVMAVVNERRAEVSKATVYNTLNLFVARKLIREVIVDPNKVFYDPNTAPHHHFYDVESGRLTDIDVSAISVVGLPPLPEGMVSESVEVIIRIRPLA